MYNKNVAIAIMMFSIFGDDLMIDENKQQDLVTLTNPEDNCYCTITKAQYDNLFAQLDGLENDEELEEELGEAANFDKLMEREDEEFESKVTSSPLAQVNNDGSETL